MNERIPIKENIIEEFITELEIENYSEGTVYEYRWTLNNFFSYCNKEVNDLNHEDVLKWLETYQKDKGPHIINQRLSALSSFFNYCITEGYINKNLIKTRWYRKLPVNMPRFLDKTDIAKVLVQSEHLPLRNRVIIIILISSGIRVGELAKLNISDIDLDKRELRIQGKGDKERIAHISKYCSYLIEQLIKCKSSKNDYLLESRLNRKLSKRSIQDVVHNFGIKLGLEKSLYAHAFRHTFATELVDKGADLRFVADELGHESITTAEIYAHIPDQNIINFYRKCMG
ncbi:hypothetical protein N752_29475 [Desulforamulus aquiferis]|nr:site-specific tyrosine recombinase/integron integrase [Desulforamulus aquiferis]RYD01709.1 hypothetical protein N752_29475 [Desulforamulus aquiferis]